MINLVEEWGKWASDHKDDLGSQSAWMSVMRGNVEFECGRSYCITDDDALVVDKAVSMLARHSVVLLNVLCYKHLAGWSLREIAREYLTVLEYGDAKGKKQVAVYDAKAMLNRAEGYVMGAMEKT